MTHQLFHLPRPTAISNNLTLVAGAKVSFFLTETSTPTNTYQDSDLATPHTNPVVADSAGRLPAIYLDPSIQYRVTFTDSDDVEIYPAIDPVNDQVLSQAIIGALLYPRTQAEIVAGVTPTNTEYKELHVFRYMTSAQVADVQARALTVDVRAAVQTAISVAQQNGGTVYMPAGSYLIRRVAGVDSQFNGLHVPYTNVFGYSEHMVLRGDGRATVLCAGDNSMTVIRWSDSLGKLTNFVIDGNGKIGVTGLSMMGSDTTDASLEEHVDWNVISRVDIRSCAEGIELESPSLGGCYFNRFEWCVLYTNTRHIRHRDNATVGGVNRNTFLGVNMQGGTYGADHDGGDTNAYIHCGFDGITTAFRTNSAGSLKGFLTQDQQLIGCTWESCTTDIDCGNRRVSIIGGNCGAVGAIAGAAVPDLHLGGDAEYKIRELQLGSTSVGLRLKPSAVVYSAQPQVSTSSNQSGAYPFNADGHLIIQGRQSNTIDITARTGSASTERLRIGGSGHVNFLNSDVSFDHGSDVVIANGATITTALTQSVSVNPAGAVTGIILEAGTQPGQQLFVMNRGAGSVTFAAFGTSNVADGTSTVIAVNKGVHFIWNANTSGWYSCY